MPKIDTFKEQESRWQAERDCDTLIECEAIEADPKRLAAARKIAKERLLTVASVVKETTGGKDD